MTLSQAGIDYICRNFGDYNNCCVATGLSWYYTGTDGINYNESGGTAQIVSRLVMTSIVQSLTMTSPTRGTFTYIDIELANYGAVTLDDAREIANHDETVEGQWCAGATAPPTTAPPTTAPPTTVPPTTVPPTPTPISESAIACLFPRLVKGELTPRISTQELMPRLSCLKLGIV